MKINSFRDLLVWEKAHTLVLEIYKITESFPSNEQFGLISQIRRSSISVCANIAEGYVKSKNDFIRFLDIARGSLEETKCHLILSKDLGYCSEVHFNKLFSLSDEVGKMLYSLKHNLRY